MTEKINSYPNDESQPTRFATPEEREKISIIECSIVWSNIARRGQSNPESPNENQ